MRSLRPLLACGVAAAALSVATDLVAGSLSNGYDFVHQSSSDLGASGAATRPLVVPLEITHDLLLIAFGAGLWRLGSDRRALRWTAGFVTANAVSGLVAELFPMQIGQPASDNTAGVVVGAAGVLALIAAIAAGAVAVPGRVRAFSVAILLAFAGLTALALTVSREPTIGLQERTMAYAYLIWIAVFASVMWRRPAAELAAQAAAFPTDVRSA
jgi:hypothetical protein